MTRFSSHTRYPFLFVLTVLLLAAACKENTPAEDEDAPAETITPVTLTHPETRDMEETVTVNAVSAFLLKTYAKANANGYLQSVSVRVGDYVLKGETLFVIKTKEAEALGNTINNLDTSLHFRGTIPIRSPGSGYITQLSFSAGSYVQDGEQLAEITDTKSFVFLMDLPYELRRYLPLNKKIALHLPDSTVLPGVIRSALPTVDSVSQTERLIIGVNSRRVIPENLIAKVALVKKREPGAVILPKAAVLSDETQSEFWIMRLINDSTAVKTPVQKGIETTDEVQILAPLLPDSARIVLTGNYGLADTALVKIQ